MKVALLICTYNRPQYLKQCLDSLRRADLSRIDELMIVDDASTNPETLQLIDGFNFKDSHKNLTGKLENKGIKDSLLIGYEQLFQRNDIVINLDSDALVRNDFVDRLISNYPELGGCILTGFHSVTKNANGTDRHKIKYEANGLYCKESVGGINFCIDKYTYNQYVKPSLLKIGNWDHNSCISAGGALCLKESVIEHIGFDSSMNHTEQPDVAVNFVPLHLPDVTLLCVDNRPDNIQTALKKCTEFIKFGDIQLLHPDIRSKEAYSEYLVREAYKYVKTEHCLIFQHDGFVNNWQAWSDEFLQYDYIGATWWYNDSMNVGNGGFSLRSRRLMELSASICKLTHPEDHHICRTYRKELEAHGMKFAPDEVADKFSYEGYRQPHKKLTNQFGVHKNKTMIKPKSTGRRYIIGQFASLGDIIWLVPLVRALMDEGNDCIWPVNPEYLSLKKHWPDINFVDKTKHEFPYESRMPLQTIDGQWIPYRFASENMGKGLDMCMQAKYSLYGHRWEMFRELTWARDRNAEAELMKGLPKKYILVNRYYGNQAQYQITPQIDSKLPIVEMSARQGFTMLDWVGVIEGAKEIHSANTSLLYILESLKLDMPIHLYSRNGLWGENGFSYTQFLHSKPYILHS